MAISSVALQAYTNALNNRPLLQQRMPDGAKKASFANTMENLNNLARTADKNGNIGAKTLTETVTNSLGKVNQLQQEKADMIQAFAAGEKQNVHELMISLQKAGMAVSLTSAVRNKVLDAYKELSKMHF